MEQDLRDGQHRNPTNHPAYWTTAFFHHADELRAEVVEAGFEVMALVGVEGPAQVIRDLDAWWDDASRRRRLLALLRSRESEPTLLGASPHLLVVGRRDG